MKGLYLVTPDWDDTTKLVTGIELVTQPIF